ncbi:hypothetical protein JCM18694_09230 [Prolixibacter denitrificans]|nr:hypothetical protein JCM18694_09230 [Prolixibacter denitrificans]
MHAQTSIEKNSISEFNAGKTIEYFSNGQGKSQGLKIHLKYPQSWKSLEGRHPHVLVDLVQPGNYVNALLMVRKSNDIFTKPEISHLLSKEGLNMFVPPNGSYISSNSNIQIEGQRAGLVNYTMTGKRMNRVFFSYSSAYIVIYQDYIFTLTFMVTNKIGESESSVKNRYDAIKPLFGQMFNSIVIDNIWE